MRKKWENGFNFKGFWVVLCILGCFVYLLPTVANAQTGAISGRVTDGSVGIFDIAVVVYDSNYNYLSHTNADANGDYTVTGLASGDHKVEFLSSGTGYVSEWYNDKADFSSADLVTVTAPDTTTGIDAVLELPGSISGRVTDGSVGIYDIRVSVYDINHSWVGSDYTDSNGDYTVPGLRSGDHKVEFNNNGTVHLSEWYNDKVDFSSADLVTVTASDTTTGIDAVLELGGSISGRVTNGSAGISDISVSAYSYSDATGDYTVFSKYNYTDGNGDYAITGLPSDEYKVKFTDYDYGQLSEWYDGKANVSSADPVTVTAPDTTTGIDAVLQKLGYELAVDFGSSGLWHYDFSWTKLTNWDADDDLAGWSGGLGVDFGGNGLWNNNGSSWSRITTWDAGNGGLAGWSGGLAVDFDGNGLWNYNGSWAKMTNWDPDGDMVGCLGGLWVDFGTNGLWSYDGSSWSRITTGDAGSAGLTCWSGGLAVDFDGSGLWNYDGSAWVKLTNWDPEDDLTGWPGSLAVDFGANGLWSYDGSSWSRLTTWDAGVMTGFAYGLAVDFDANGMWKYDGSSWTKITNWNPENMDDVDLN